jgi:hypothetical protein
MKQYYILMIGIMPYQRLHTIHTVPDSARACMENMVRDPEYSSTLMELIAVTVNEIGTVINTNTIHTHQPVRGIQEAFAIDY